MEADAVVRALDEKTKPGRDAHRLRLRRYDDSYNIYRASEQRARGLELWQSKLRIPYARQVIDTELVNLVQGKPRVNVRPRRPEDELSAKMMQVLLDYYVAEDHMVEAQPLFTQQGLIYGVTAAKVHWLYNEVERMGRQQAVDPMTGQTALQAGPMTVVERDGPTFEPWNVYDCWWDPNGRDVDSCQYVSLRSYVTRDEILENEHDPDTGRGIYRNVQALLATVARERDASAQETQQGDTRNKRKGLIELVETWHRVKGQVWLSVVGNGQVLLRHEPSPFWHGKIPVVVAQCRPDLFEIQGLPETELIDHLQQAAWTIQNMRMDNLHLTVMRGITYRSGGVTDPNSLVLRPRFKWAVMDHDDVKPFEIPPVPPEAYHEQDSLHALMQLITGVNPYNSASGGAIGVDQNTATGITALQDVASRVMRFMAGQLQQKGYQRTFELWGDLAQQFLDGPKAVKIVGPNAQEGWIEVGPAEIAGHYHYVLEGSEESLSRQQERGEAIALLNAFAPFVQLGVVRPDALIEKVAAAYNFPNPQALLAPPQQPVQASPGGFQQNSGQQAQQLLGGQNMNPAIQAMIQQGR